MSSHPHAPTPATTDAPGATPTLPAPYTGGRLPRLIVVLCFLITAVATALIYWRWANVTEPSSYVIVQGQEEHNGTVVVIRSDTHPEAMATLSPDNHYAVTIFLHPGTYTLTATQNGETLIHGSMLVAHRRWKTITLRPRRATPGDTPQRAGVSS
jgi:hypothetical protein